MLVFPSMFMLSQVLVKSRHTVGSGFNVVPAILPLSFPFLYKPLSWLPLQSNVLLLTQYSKLLAYVLLLDQFRP